jgi:hypothetical protein
MIKLKNILLENTRSDVTLSDMFHKNKTITHGESQIIDGPLNLFQRLFITNFAEDAKNMNPPMTKPDNDFGDNTSRAIAIVNDIKDPKDLTSFSLGKNTMIKLGVAEPKKQRDWIKAESDFNTGITIVAGLKRRGFSLKESCAIAGNLWVESKFSPTAVNSISNAYGIAQWLGERYKSFIKYIKDDKSKKSLSVQLDFLTKELTDPKFSKNGYEALMFKRAMAYGNSVEEKTHGFAAKVERAGADVQKSLARRQGAAIELYNYFSKK